MYTNKEFDFDFLNLFNEAFNTFLLIVILASEIFLWHK